MKENKVQRKLEKIARKTIAKNMRNLEDIMADYIADPNIKLDEHEAALLDRQVFEKTGKHIGKFKNPKKKLPKNVDIVISADGDAKGQKDPVSKALKVRKEPKISSAVSVNGAIS